MSRESDLTERLRREITRAIVDGTGMREQVALPMADAVLAWLQAEHPGQRVYIPAPKRRYPILEIEGALRKGVSIKTVMAEYNLSRTTMYELFPDGLPRPESGVVREFVKNADKKVS